MESHGIADQIQVTEAVYERTKTEFVFQPRGLVDVKGKGPTLTYLLVGRVGEALEEDLAKGTVTIPASSLTE